MQPAPETLQSRVPVTGTVDTRLWRHYLNENETNNVKVRFS